MTSIEEMSEYSNGKLIIACNGHLGVRNGDSETNGQKDEDVNDTSDQRGATVRLRNKHIDGTRKDILFHFAINTHSHDLQAMFGDVKFVCVGGSVHRMEAVAQSMMRQLGWRLPVGQTLVNVLPDTDRYAMYKVGPVLTVSHGIGVSSFSVMMHELIKLLHYAKASDVTIFRIGTSGGIGLKPGTVVVSREAVDTLFRNYQELHVLGKVVRRPATLNRHLVDELLDCSKEDDRFQVTSATTMCALDFYEGQARLDGAFCDYTEEDKMEFLQHAHSRGVRNIEMESVWFAGMCHHAKIPGAIVCVTMLDRLKDDQVAADRATCKEWEERPALIVSRFIQQRLNNGNWMPQTSGELQRHFE